MKMQRMNAPLIGVIVGGILGVVDGLSAWFYPEARPLLIPIVRGSTIKGVLTGLVAGIASGRARVVALLLCAAASAIISAQPQSQSDNPSLRRSIRSSAGGKARATGQPGRSTVEREYTKILNPRFVHLENRAVYPPQEKTPKGEEHEDIGIFSVDGSRKRIVFRQFHSEGFVNQYLQELQPAGRPLVFVTESIENIAAGWRGRETYTLTDPDEFEEIFELAPPGNPSKSIPGHA